MALQFTSEPETRPRRSGTSRPAGSWPTRAEPRAANVERLQRLEPEDLDQNASRYSRAPCATSSTRSPGRSPSSRRSRWASRRSARRTSSRSSKCSSRGRSCGQGRGPRPHDGGHDLGDGGRGRRRGALAALARHARGGGNVDRPRSPGPAREPPRLTQPSLPNQKSSSFFLSPERNSSCQLSSSRRPFLIVDVVPARRPGARLCGESRVVVRLVETTSTLTDARE
jgi:hypothetical protein